VSSTPLCRFKHSGDNGEILEEWKPAGSAVDWEDEVT
jgi:hypothetical protein